MSTRTPYDEVVYESHAYPGTHPDHLASMARLFGMDPAPPSACRVLELGSAAGGNLMPWAVAYPESEFVGVDLSSVQIGIGEERRKAMGLDNLTLRAMDILDVGDTFGTFDYVVCHGVYSWVPRIVQDEILRLCRTLLAPQGVAYVSYNCYPGWHMRGLVRDMMMYHAKDFATPEEKTGQARALLDFLANVSPEGTDPYTVLLKSEADMLSRMTDYYLFHEHLSADNEPLYFHQFMDRARAAELQFLGEASLATMLPEQFPDHVREILGQITGDIERMEQYMDFVRNRTFRQTLLVHREVELERTLGAQQARPFHLSSPVTCAGDAVFHDDSEVVFENEEQTIVTESPLVKTALGVLMEAWPESIPFDDLVARVLDAVPSADPDDAIETIGGNMIRCMASSVVEFRTEPNAASKAGERPEASPYARFQVQAGVDRLTNLRHQTANVDALIKSSIRVLDGTRDMDAVIDAMVGEVREGRLSVSTDDGEIVTEERLREVFAEVMPGVIATLERQSFLVG